MATGKHIFRGVVEVPEAKEKEQAVNLGQVKDLIDRYNKEPVKVVSTKELKVDNVDSSTGKLTLTDKITKIDEVEITIKDEILLAAQTDKTQNGVYVVESLGEDIPSSSSASVTGGTGVTDVIVDNDAFETNISTNGNYVFTYDGTTDNSWKYNGSNVVLDDYGVTITGMPSDGDEITVTYTEAYTIPASLVRRQDFAIKKVILNNTFVNVMEGKTNGDTRWTIVSDGVLKCGDSSFIFIKDIDKSAGSINVFKGTITGDGNTTAFTLSHNLNLKDEEAYLVCIKDNTGANVYVDDAPTVGNEKNSITLAFDNAPKSTEEFKVFVLALS